MLEQSVHRALALHQSGNLAEAEPLYVSALKQLPDHPDLLHMYGVLQHQQGHAAPAIAYISRAIKANPKNAAFHNNLGEVYRLSGDFGRAIESFRKATRVDPKYFAAHQHLGNVLLEARRPAEAMLAYRNALALAPSNVQTLQFMAVAADGAGDNAAALEAFDELLRLRPEDVESARNRAIILNRLGRFAQAAAAYQRAVELDPGHQATLFAMVDSLDKWVASDAGAADAVRPLLESAYRRILEVNPEQVETLVRLGVLLLGQNRVDEALIALRLAGQLAPQDPLVLLHLGGALQQAPLIAEAIATYQAALALDATIPALHADLAAALAKAGRLDEALAAADRAIALNSAHGPAWNNRATILQDLARAADAIDAFRTAADLAPENAAIGSNLLYAQHYLAHDANQLFRQHQNWAARFAATPQSTLPYGRVSDGCVSEGRPLRVGLLSGDFKNHSVARFVEPLLANLDPQRIAVTCYSNVPLEDAVTARLRLLAHGWRPITGLADATVAAQIQNDQIDILIDLSGHTAHNRLAVMARRPAPVQMTWLGYPNTTGLAQIDYRITDDFADPICGADFQACPAPYYTEKLIALPTAWCFQPPENAPDLTPPPAVGCGFVTFASFNNLLKVTADMMALWSRILLAVPKSRLLLKAGALGNLSVRSRMLEQFSALGISPLRVDLRPVERDTAAHLALYNSADIALDTFPYAGTATTCEALWMGLPVVTLAGDSHLSRVGASLLSSLGMPDCVAAIPDEYVRIATRLAADLPALTERRAGLRARMASSPLCNGPAFAAAFTEMLEGLQAHHD